MAHNVRLDYVITLCKGFNCYLRYTSITTFYNLTFVYAEGNGDLYYYVGDGIVNPQLVNVARIEEKITDLIPNNSSLIASYPMISGQYINFEVGATRTKYTAPANGWFVVSGHFAEGGWAVYNSTTLLGNSCFNNSGNQNYGKSATPVLKGQKVTTYLRGGTIDNFRFVYAKGSESEAP